MRLAWQEERGQRRLQFLLKQAEVFQHFAPAASEKEKKCAHLPALHAKEVACMQQALACCNRIGALDLQSGLAYGTRRGAV